MRPLSRRLPLRFAPWVTLEPDPERQLKNLDLVDIASALDENVMQGCEDAVQQGAEAMGTLLIARGWRTS